MIRVSPSVGQEFERVEWSGNTQIKKYQMGDMENMSMLDAFWPRNQFPNFPWRINTFQPYQN